MKKVALLISLLSFCALLLSGQSLTELSKKEKERREKLKGKTSIVLNNASLKKTQRPAAVLAPPPVEEDDESDAEDESGEEAPTSNRIVPTQRETQEDSDADKEANADEVSLEEKWEAAKEYVNLLTLKMNALWQEFYSMDDMTPRDHIQQQISDTYLKLEKAKEEEERLRQEIERR